MSSLLSSGQEQPEISSVFSLLIAVCSFYFAFIFNCRIHTQPEKAGNKLVVVCSALNCSCVMLLRSSLWRGACNALLLSRLSFVPADTQMFSSLQDKEFKVICQSRTSKSLTGKRKNPNLTAPRPDIAGESATPLFQPDDRDDIH